MAEMLRGDDRYALQVEGDSMIDAGIQPGDMVLVEKNSRPKNNDIVVMAEVAAEAQAVLTRSAIGLFRSAR